MCGRRIRTSSARSSSAGSSRSQSPVRCSGSIRSTSPTCRRRRTRRTRCSRGGDATLEPEGSADELFASARAGRLRLRPGVHRSGARRPRIAAARSNARARRGCVVTHGLGPRYLHSTGQLHKGGPNTGLFLQVVDDQGDELTIPGKPFGFCAADPRAGRGRLRGTEGARPPRRAHSTWRIVSMQLGMIGLGRMGGNMTHRLREHGHDVKTYDPAGRSARRRRSRSSRPARRAARVLDDDARAGRSPRTRSRQLLALAANGDTIVDGGNSNFRDSQRRYAEAQAKGIHFVDAGVSGGIWGLEGRLLPDGRRRRRAGAAARAGASRRSPPTTATRTSARPAPATS